MKSVRLAEALTVSPQLEGDDFATLAAEGVRLVVNNRSPGEAPGQLPPAEAACLAATAGIAYCHVPVVFSAVTRADIDAFAALRAAAEPVHAYCRSGTRSANLWRLGEILDDATTCEQASAFAAPIAIGVKDALAWLQRHHAAAPP